jgi:hypothetical protein
MPASPLDPFSPQPNDILLSMPGSPSWVLEGMTKWPSTKEDIIAAGKAKGAPKETLDALSGIPNHSYGDIKAVIKELKAAGHSG